MRRFPWGIVLGLLVGLGLGLAYSWVISPVRVSEASPAALRPDFKDHYRSAIAAAYAANGNLPRAQERLALLGDADPVEALNAQAQRMLASGANGQPPEAAEQVAVLAAVLEQGIAFESTPTSSIQIASTVVITSTPPSEPSDIPLDVTASPPALETQPAIDATSRPTQTRVPTLGAPFALTDQETVCDPNLPDGLLQVVVFNSSRRQLAGAKIIITWDGGEEEFFTGLKPELGNGYADFLMEPNVAYTVQLGAGSDIASGLTPSTCQSPAGETFRGGIKLTFQQP
ncbi:MAG TPA: hypothetical protein VJ821_04480 [Anaerolineales bacterium]|nr:hypothetical protein [Anaerolineales bacterium]